MAAYAAVVSLMNTVEQIMDHPRLSTSLDRNQIDSLQEKAGFLLDFIERYNSHGVMTKEAQFLESQIASAAHAAEDVIESHVVDLIQNGGIGSTSLLDSKTKRKAMRQKVKKFQEKMRSKTKQLQGDILKEIIQDMDSIKEKVNRFEEEIRANTEEQPTYDSMPAASSRTPITTGKDAMVGFDEELIQLMDVLTGQQSSLRIIPIVGMGGSGKTTLARNVYEKPLITQYFDVCAWTTISQEYNVREVFLELLSRKGTSSNEALDELGEKLHKHLFGRRYLIVLDDIWSAEAWDKMKFFFPNNCNGSRIVITTRLSNLAIDICGSTCFRMNFLDEDKSWNLFCQKVFGQEDCPSELEETGKKIVEQCGGLPLSIVVIGGVLRKSNRTKGYWQNLAENINSILTSSENEQCLDILYLSYTHLPAHLKPCFLYLGIFKEDHEIRVSELIKLWVAEGFLKANGIEILEDTAEHYIEDLVDRNIILASMYRPNGKIKSFRLHDLLRELCLRVAKRESFFRIARENNIPQVIGSERRLIFYGLFERDQHKVFEVSQSAQLARSLTCEITEAPIKFKLLRVLNKATDWCTDAKFQNFNLRYFAYQPWLRWSRKLPSSISLIWNLQTLIITHYDLVVAPLEIWKMTKLRHLQCSNIFLPEPPPSDEEHEPFVLENLQTLSSISNFKWNEEICKRIPNIRTLCLSYCDNDSLGWDSRLHFNIHNVGDLLKLESLDILCFTSEASVFEVKNAFPSSLKSLVLRGCILVWLSFRRCILHWEDMTMIGSLPQLEVLKLEENAVVGDEWSPVEGEFLRLKLLSIENCHLRCWNAEGSHFPVLEKLVLHGMGLLNEIPLGIGEIPTLQLIKLTHCGETVSVSGIRVKEEQESFGNDALQIQVRTYDNILEHIRKRMEVEGLSIRNVQLLEHFI